MNRDQQVRPTSRDRNYLLILLVLLVFILLVIPLLPESTASRNFLKLGVTILMLVEKVRFEEYFNGMKYPDYCYENLKHQHGLGDTDIVDIKEKVEELGPLTSLDVAASLVATAMIEAHSLKE